MLCSMEDLMNFVHELVEGDYDTQFTTNEVNNISFDLFLVH